MSTVPSGGVAPRAVPSAGAVLRAQLGVAGFHLRGVAIVGAGLLLIASVVVGADAVNDPNGIPFRPHHSFVPGLLGLVFAGGIWRGRERVPDALLWTLPVERSRLVLARVSAGWLWLMAATALFVLWLLVVTLVTAGPVIERGESPPPWMVPFTAATALYLMVSALVIGLRRPGLWTASAALAFALFAGLSDLIGRMAESRWLVFLPSRVAEAVWEGDHGLEMLLVARTHRPEIADSSTWAAAALLWCAAGLIVLAAAIARHRERRRR